MIQAAEALGQGVGVAAACEARGVPRSTLYRTRQQPANEMPSVERPPSARALSAQDVYHHRI